jgi:hypothetical protein
MHKFPKFILEWNSTCFGQFLCPSSGVIHCTLSNGGDRRDTVVKVLCYKSEGRWFDSR